PARKRLPVVQVDRRPQGYDCAGDLDTVPMAFVAVLRPVFPIEHGSGWIKRRPQVAAVHAIDKRGAKSSGIFSRRQLLDLLRQRCADHVVGIERKHPRACDAGKTKIALAGKTVEGPGHDLSLREPPDYLQRSVAAAAIDHQYPRNPAERRKSP